MQQQGIIVQESEEERKPKELIVQIMEEEIVEAMQETNLEEQCEIKDERNTQIAAEIGILCCLHLRPPEVKGPV
ncbi:hypothetical protein BDZ91DRAFT_787606 [Kalaharituber pfeilii]|nr:hypothetical protein BDZ91DRAFT_787606 [Kalaharituber pfeilii]